MPSQTITRAKVRNMVTRIARELAEERGRNLSEAALAELLRPSAKYFAERKFESVSEMKLREELAPIIDQAVGLVQRDEGSAEDTNAVRLRVDGRTRSFRRNPRPPKKSVRKE